jgi:hypothetical protein
MKHIHNLVAAKVFLFLIVQCLTISSITYAASAVWNGAAANGLWSDGGNWTNGSGAGGIPNALDDVTIPAGFSYNTDVDQAFIIRSLTISSGTNEGTVTLGADLTLTQATGFVQNGGSFDAGSGSHNFRVFQVFTISGGTFDAGNARITLGANFSFSGGTFDSDNSTFVFGSTSGNTITSNTDLDFNNIVHNPGLGTSTLVFNGNGSSPDETFTINGTFTRGNESQSVSFSNGSNIDYASGASLEYEGASKTVSSEWPTGVGNGVPNVELAEGTLTLSGSSVYEVTESLTRSDGGISVGSADLQYNSASLIYNDYSKTVGDEWPNDTDAPESVTIDPGSGNTITLDFSVFSADVTITNDLDVSSGTLTTQGTYDVIVGGNITTGTLTTDGNFTNTSGTSYISMEGNQSQIITGGSAGSSILNLRVNKTSSTDVVTLNTGILKVSGTLNIQTGILALSASSNQLDITGATFDIDADGTYRTGGKTITTDVSTSYTFDASSTFEYNGASAETTIEDAQYGNLTVNNANGLNILGDITVDGTLDFDAGTINVTGSNTLTLGTTSNITGVSSARYVNGPLRRVIGNTTATSFPIGTSSAYRPATFQYASAPGSAQTIEMEYFASNPGGNLPSGISQIATGGYYTLDNITGTSTPNYGLTLRYTDAGFSPETKTRILVQNGSGPDYSVPSGQTHNPGNDDVSVTGIVDLPSDSLYLAFGSGGTTTTWSAAATTTDWATAANWDNGVPTSVDDAIIQSSTNNPEIGSGDAATVNTLNIQSGASLTFSDGSDIEVTSTASGALTVAGTFTINTNAKVDFNNGGYSASATTLTGTVIYGATSSVQPDTYTNLQVNGASGNASGTTTVTGDYTNTSGSPSFNNLDITGDMTLTAGSPSGTIEVEGDISSSGGNVAGTVTMNGTSAQNISGNFTFNNLTINNSNGVALSSGATPTINGALTLTSGVLDASTGTSLTLLNSTSGGDNNSYINGLVTIQMSGTTNPYAIATGDNGLQRTIAIIPANTTSTEYEVEFFEGDLVEPDVLQDPPLQAVSDLYYWSVERTSGSTNAQITLYYDGINDGISTDASVRVARYESSGSPGWFDQGPTTNGGTSSVTSDALTVYAQRNYTLGTSNSTDNPLPVELMSFEGTSTQNGIALNWETASEKDSRGFILSRRSSSQGNWQVVSTYAGNSALEATNSLSGASYSYLDNIALQAGQSLEYQLEEEDISGNRVVLETINVESKHNTIQSYSLTQNYPNPFNPSTTIGYELKDNAKVNIVVYNALGQAVQTLVNENQGRGKYNVQFNAGDLSSGIYFYRMVVSGATENFTDVRKMMLVK